MPELPEVETIVRDLSPHVSGRMISAVTHLNPAVLRYPSPELFAPGLMGQRASWIRRRGKFIQIALGSGELLVVHLGMTGTLTLEPTAAALRPHTHLRLGLDSGAELRYRDPRRFGRVLLGELSALEAMGVMPRLGAEPLSRGFVEGRVDEVLRLAHRPVKAVLLDQSVIAGCGNIYADEACFLARVRPARPAWTLTAPPGSSRLLRIVAGTNAKAASATSSVSARETVTPMLSLHVTTPGGGGRPFRIIGTASGLGERRMSPSSSTAEADSSASAAEVHCASLEWRVGRPFFA